MALSIPAAIAAKFNTSEDIEKNAAEVISKSQIKEFPKASKALSEYSSENLKLLASVQDSEGKTILHREYSEDMVKALSANLESEELLKLFSIRDNSGKLASEVDSSGKLKDYIVDFVTAENRNLPLDEALDCLKINNVNKNLIKFLECRQGKPSANSNISGNMLGQLRSEDGLLENVDLDNQKAYYEDVPLEVAANFFIEDDEDEYYSVIFNL